MNILNEINSNPDLLFILIRCFILYLIAVLILRVDRRIHLESSFDFVFIIMFGTILERGIFLDSTTFINALLASSLLLILQKLLAYSTFYSRIIGKMLKGGPIVLYQNGRFHKNTMQSEQVTEEDIMAACRRELQCDTLDCVKKVQLERTGKLSFIKSKDEA